MCPSCPTPSPADRTTLGPSSVFHTVPDIVFYWTWGSNFSCEPQIGLDKLEQVGCWCFHGKSRDIPPMPPPSQETRPHWGGLVPLDFHDVSIIFEEQKNSSSSTSLLDGHDCESEVLVLFASQDTNK